MKIILLIYIFVKFQSHLYVGQSIFEVDIHVLDSDDISICLIQIHFFFLKLKLPDNNLDWTSHSDFE